MKNIIYILGHRNPDTDSMVSAVSLAELRTLQGVEGVVPARTGAANYQTEYIFNRLDIPLPILITNLHPRVEFYMEEDPVVINEDTPLWEAMRLNDIDDKAIPVINADGQYHSMLHYGVFTKNVLSKINPNTKAIIPTSVSSLVKTIQAQPMCVFNEDEIFNGIMSVAIMEATAYKTYLEAEPTDNKIVIIGDRPNAQKIAISMGVRVMIIVNGSLPSKEIKTLAEEKGVSILVSSYDTSNTVFLIIYSTQVSSMSDDSIKPLHATELMKNAKNILRNNACHAVAVVDQNNKVIGLLDESSFLKEPNIELILVDHNELSQAIQGAEHYRIREVVDHHHIGSLTTSYPINFINRVVGATSTIVASMYRESKVSLSKKMASLLLCGILSDTLILRSTTTTNVDIEMANYLANITDLDIQILGEEIMQASSAVVKKSTEEIISIDRKEYEIDNISISVSQIEVTILTPMMNRKKELFKSLTDLKEDNNYFATFLLVTDINSLSSVLLVCSDKSLGTYLPYPEISNDVFELKDVLSRKKQLMPMLFEIIDKVRV